MNFSDRIIPTPKKLNVYDKKITLGDFGKVAYRLEVAPAQFSTQKAAARLKAMLCDRFGCESTNNAGFVITLKVANAPEDIKNAEQGYSITAKRHGITLCAFGSVGAYYAVTTLLQILKEEDGSFSIPEFSLVDYPDFKKRGHFIETRFGTDLMELDDWKRVVDSMVEVKENQLTVSVYGCWNMQYDNRISEYVFLPFKNYEDLKTPVYKKYYSAKKGDYVFDKTITPMVQKDFFGDLRQYGYEHEVEVVPMINSFGHNTLIPRLYPEVSAKDENGNPSNTGFCTAEKKTYDILFDLYDQIIDRYSTPDNPIESFDIGLDEVRNEFAVDPSDITHRHNAWCQCPVCRNKSHQEIHFEHAAKLISHLRSRGVKTVYMYNDMIFEHKTRRNPEPKNHSALFKQTLTKYGLLDVTCIDWWDYDDNPENCQFSDLHPELNIRSSIKPWNGYYHWSHVFHPVKNSYHMLKMAIEAGAEAKRSYSSWDNSYHRPNQLQADWAWNFEGTGSVEDAKLRYVRRYFGNSVDEAQKAFDLFDAIAYQKPPSLAKDGINRRDALWNHMVYYGYSYYNNGKDYPRNYPGETVAKLRDNDTLKNEIYNMLDDASSCAALFEVVADKNPKTHALAMRYRYEALLYVAICRDWTTLIELDSLQKQFSKTNQNDIIEQMIALASEQKRFRRDVIALLEDTKEAYLIPSHARNQTIPMQFFADLEAYLKSTPADKLKLDFADMRHIASETFMKLR